MKRKVAIIDTLGSHGGAFHFYTFGQCKGLLKAGVNVSLYSNNETLDPCYETLKFYTFYHNLFASRFKLVNGFKWIIGSIKSILHARCRGVSVFHFHIFYSNILILFNLILVKIFFGKIVLTIHDVKSFANNKDSSIISKLIYKLTDLLLTHNKFSKSELINVTPRMKNYIYIIPHGNYLPFINIRKDKQKSREYLGLFKDKTILLFFGMIKKVKGLDILLQSLKEVVDENPDVVLLIAGRLWENDFSEYQQIIDKNNLSENVLLHNKFIAHGDVEHYYCASDLVVLPYKKIYQSGVLMMALSYERPVLTSDLLPLREVIKDNESGFLFKSESASDLTIKLNKILRDRENMERVRLNGYNLINNKFDWDAIGRLTKKAYQTI